MKKMEESGKHQKIEFPATLGKRMFSFGLKKSSSAMKGISRLFHENNVIQRISMLKNGSVRFSREWHQKRRLQGPHLQWRLPNEPQVIEGAMNRRRLRPGPETGEKAALQPALPFFSAPSPAGRQSVSQRRLGNERDSLPLLKRRVSMSENDHRAANEDHFNTTKNENAREQGMVLPRSLLNVFSRLFRMKLPPVTVHQNRTSDAFLAHHRADAMTMGTHIYFKTGTFDLTRNRGLGLLGHELTHVAQLQGGVRRASRDSYERPALANERLILANGPPPSMKSAASNSAYRMTTPPGAFKAAQPMTTNAPLFADSSREVNNFSPPAPEPVAATLSANDMMRIKDEVYRDLMLRIKVDFERGA